MDKIKNRIIIGIITLALALAFTALASAQSQFNSQSTGGFINQQPSQPSFQTSYTQQNMHLYWPQITENQQDCKAIQSLVLNVPPAGCQPAVVRSDLLADQNVPVFCQIDALKLNPLLDIKSINKIRFTGTYPKEVYTTAFHPAREALSNRDVLTDGPIITNVGYVVIVLKQNAIEKSLPDYVNVNLTAQIDYKASNSIGVGKAEFKLKEYPIDSDWEANKAKSSFWDGRYYIRLLSADVNNANVAIYAGDKRVATQTLKLGTTSNPIHMPGSYCQVGLQLAYDSVEAADNLATIEVRNGAQTQTLDLYKGSRFADNKCTIDDVTIDTSSSPIYPAGQVTFHCGSFNNKQITLSLVRVQTENGAKTDSFSASQTDEAKAFYAAIEKYKQVVEDYPLEKEVNVQGTQSYGEQALAQAIKLAKDKQQAKTLEELQTLLKEKYTNSELSGASLELSKIYNIEGTTTSLKMDGQDYQVTLRALEAPSRIPSASFTYETNLELKRTETKEIGSAHKLTLLRVYPDKVDVAININKDAECKTGITQTVNPLTIKKGETIIVCNKPLTLNSVTSEDVFNIRVIPLADTTQANTQLNVRIGIEKRAIQLSPERTKKMINNIDESINKWGAINDRVKKVVEGMKGACLATAATLMAKNLVFGGGVFGGATSMARPEVTQKWSAWCSTQKQYATVDACLGANGDKIEREVKAYASSIDNTNAVLSNIEKDYSTPTGLLGGKTVDSGASADKLCETIKSEYSSETSYLNCTKGYKEGRYTYQQLRDLYRDLQRSKSSEIDDKQNINSNINTLKAQITSSTELAKAKTSPSLSGVPGIITLQGAKSNNYYSNGLLSRDNLKEDAKTALKNAAGASNDAIVNTAIVPVAIQTEPAKPETLHTEYYLVGLDNGGNILAGTQVTAQGTQTAPSKTLDKAFFTQQGIGTIKPITPKELNGKRIESPKVSFFSNEPYKGLPAIVPLTKHPGFYVGMEQTIPTMGGIKSYDSSGRPVQYNICFVGDNNKIDFQQGRGDDKCQIYNLDIQGTPANFLGILDAQQTKSLVDDARNALLQAANQANKGSVVIDGQSYPVDTPALPIPTAQCQNFMSANDCKWMFNICDPVICPTSRCDLGGRYPVSNVIGTGIVGSIVLCLPNANWLGGDVYIPVCLSGISAGIDGYVSLLKDHRDCLNVSLNDGKMIGICDEIYSVGLCDFFWKQIAPFAKLIIPKLIETAYGQQNVGRGGGEYLSVASAWNNMDESMKYFTQTYAVNSFQAFQAGSIENFGSEVCKSRLSGSAPISLKSLTKADSPPQFYATFSTSPYSDATVPPTSQYKVYFHIFSGNSATTNYQVYLKDPPESTGAAIPSTIAVGSGTITQGNYKSETKDFTAPTGYKQLCVVINGEEHCGFKQVTTSFALNIAADTYTKSQAEEQGITTEAGCISGTISASSTLGNLNPQAAAEELTNPQIYNRGIVRICASGNPGTNTDPTRYQDVGYCGSQGLRCWLDRHSVQNALSDSNQAGITLGNISSASNLKNLVTQGKFVTAAQSIALLDALDVQQEKLNAPAQVINTLTGEPEKVIALLTQIDITKPKLSLNPHLARLEFIKAKVYGKVARAFTSAATVSPPSKDENNKAPEVTSTKDNVYAFEYSGDLKEPREVRSIDNVPILKNGEPSGIKIILGGMLTYNSYPIGGIDSPGDSNKISIRTNLPSYQGLSDDVKAILKELNGKSLNDLKVKVPKSSAETTAQLEGAVSSVPLTKDILTNQKPNEDLQIVDTSSNIPLSLFILKSTQTGVPEIYLSGSTPLKIATINREQIVPRTDFTPAEIQTIEGLHKSTTLSDYNFIQSIRNNQIKSISSIQISSESIKQQ